MAIAMPIPSAGSVPDPSSSRSTRLSGPAFFKISSTFVIWAENVDRFSERFCPSPISHSTRLFIQRTASSHGTWSPHCAIIQNSPTVFIATVLPPVFGPVITTPFPRSPSSKLKGTASSRRISGCLPFLIRMFRSVLICGSFASIAALSFPLAKIKSSFSISLLSASKTS